MSEIRSASTEGTQRSLSRDHKNVVDGILVGLGVSTSAQVWPGRRICPIGEGMEIGRSPDHETFVRHALPDPRVSRVHAQIIRQPSGGYCIRDMGSSNGTYLDDAPVNGTEALRDGAIIVISPYVFMFRSMTVTQAELIRGEMRQPFGDLPTLSWRLAAARVRLRRLAPTSIALLITGETGVGKEVHAVAIHKESGRPGRFFAVNCAAIPEALIESELFGYSAGAHSTAAQSKKGLLEQADGGTLFLDELGSMALTAQSKLLRFLQTGCFLPLGATKPIQLDVRIVAATNAAHLSTAKLLTRDGQFGLRPDLVARLGPEAYEIPPLRERREDIGLLVSKFLSHRPGEFSPEAYEALFAYDWPGNVRELQKVVELGVALSLDGVITIDDLPITLRGGRRASDARGSDVAAPAVLNRASRTTEVELCRLLERHRGNVAQVARSLGRQRTLVWRWLRAAGLDPAQFR